MSVVQRKYAFDWGATIGADMAVARKSLGPNARIEIYRLFQFTLRDVLEQEYGTEKADKIFRAAGVKAGKAFYEKFLAAATDVPSLTKLVQDNLVEFGIGIFRVEKADLDSMQFSFTVDEDLDCSGLPDTSDVICVYDEGFIQGILEAFSGKNFKVREIDCWCTGARTCRFAANLAE